MESVIVISDVSDEGEGESEGDVASDSDSSESDVEETSNEGNCLVSSLKFLCLVSDV